MLTACWSVKGGSGTTVVAATLVLGALRAGRTVARRRFAPAICRERLGLADPTGPGLLDWLEAGPDVPADALARIAHDSPHGVTVIPAWRRAHCVRRRRRRRAPTRRRVAGRARWRAGDRRLRSRRLPRRCRAGRRRRSVAARLAPVLPRAAAGRPSAAANGGGSGHRAGAFAVGARRRRHSGVFRSPRDRRGIRRFAQRGRRGTVERAAAAAADCGDAHGGGVTRSISERVRARLVADIDPATRRRSRSGRSSRTRGRPAARRRPRRRGR